MPPPPVLASTPEIASAAPRSPARALVAGAIAVGVLDLLDALIFLGVRGVPPVRVMQSIASGLLGRDAYAGGIATALLGVGLHFFIATTVVLVYHAASGWLGFLVRRPLVFGPLYGLAVYVVMRHVVLPLSAARIGPSPWPALLNQLAIHAFGIGLPSALAARAARLGRR